MENLENQNVQNQNENVDDEISLLDLLSVVLVQRKMIIWGTAIVTVVAALWIFISPLFIKNEEKEETYNVTYTLKAVNPPSCAYSEMSGQNTAAVATRRIRDTKFIANENRKFPIFGCEEDEGYDYTTNLIKAIKKSKFNVGSVVLGTDFDVSIEVKLDEMELFDQYINDSVKIVNKELEDFIFPILDKMEALKDKSQIMLYSGDDASSGKKSSSFNSDGSEENLNGEDGENNSKYPEIAEFKKDYECFLSIPEEPFVTKNEVEQGRVKKCIISFFAAFFIFIFIAFAKNAMANLKQDKEAMKKLSDAWEAGK